MKTLFLFFSIICLTIAASANGVNDLTKNANYQKDTTIKSVAYKIYIGSKGGRFVIVTAGKTGTQYKKYLPR